MHDPYQEEAFARINVMLRQQLQKLRAEGEPRPVAFWPSPRHERFRDMLAWFGVAGDPPDGVSPLLPTTERLAAETIDRHVSPGLGVCVMGVPLALPDAFRLVMVGPGEVAVQYILMDKEPMRFGGFSVDVRAREIAIETEPGRFEKMPVDW